MNKGACHHILCGIHHARRLWNGKLCDFTASDAEREDDSADHSIVRTGFRAACEGQWVSYFGAGVHVAGIYTMKK